MYCLSYFYLMDINKANKETQRASMSQYQSAISLGLPLIVVSSMIAMPIGSQLLNFLSKT